MFISKMPNGEAEVYPAFQGEGATTGELCVFVRCALCNLSCKFCLEGGTKVLLPDGKYQEIQKLEVGDKVMSYNEETKEMEEDEVTETMSRLISDGFDSMLDIELEDGRHLRITGNHRVMTKRGWVRAENLNCDDELVLTD